MIILITGASHSGKTLLSQKLLEKYHFPCFSIDHLKMGLIRSGHTDLTPLSSDEELTEYLWPITREMIKTALENGQNLIVEGVYVPANWHLDFSPEERDQIAFYCLVLTEGYIRKHFDKIKEHSCAIEKRLEDEISAKEVILDNKDFFTRFQNAGHQCLLAEEEYDFLSQVKI